MYMRIIRERPVFAKRIQLIHYKTGTNSGEKAENPIVSAFITGVYESFFHQCRFLALAGVVSINGFLAGTGTTAC